MSYNLLLKDIVNKQSFNEIDVYKDTAKNILNIKKDINKLKKINNDNLQNKINSYKEQIQFKKLEYSDDSSLILSDFIKQKVEKTLLKKYDIKEQNISKDIDQKYDVLEDMINQDYHNIINNKYQENKNILMKKKFLIKFN